MGRVVLKTKLKATVLAANHISTKTHIGRVGLSLHSGPLHRLGRGPTGSSKDKVALASSLRACKPLGRPGTQA